MHNLPFFLEPLPNETLYSLIGRFNRLACFCDDQATSNLLFGNRKTGFIHDFPSCIDYFCEAVYSWRGKQMQCIDEMTILPYFAAFQDKDTLNEAYSSMREGNSSTIKFAFGLHSSRVTASHPLKACSNCIQADINKTGFSYWHRSHQLPGVLVCPEHGLPLINLALKTNRLEKFRYLLPVDIPRRDKTQIVPGNTVQTTLLMEIATISQDFLHSGLSNLDPEKVLQAYLTGLREKGWLRPSGRIRQQAFREDFLAYIAPLKGQPEFTFVVESADKETGFFSDLVRKPRSHKHPLKHLLLIQYLFGGLTGFINAYEGIPRSQAASTRDSLRVVRPDQIDPYFNTRMQALLVGDGLSLSEAAPLLGISVSTLAVRAERAGIPFQRRSKRLTGIFLQEIRLALAFGDTLIAICKRINLSKASIHRLLQADPDLHKTWEQARYAQELQFRREELLALLVKTPHSGRNVIKKALGSSRYIWLWHNDKTWIKSILPNQNRTAFTNRKPAVDWAVRDNLFATDILQAVEKLRNHPGKPTRVTRAAIFRLMPELGRKAFNLAKMPETQALLVRFVETTAIFRQRLMAWAQKELEQTEGDAPEYRILRLAGINNQPKRKAA